MIFPVDLLRKCWFLAGPTASGKTAVSLHLAEQINAEIVALDSMTLYRGMDVGTAKPSLDEQSRVRHHLIDVLEPHEDFSLAEYISSAKTACLAIVSRGRTPLFVGGAGLYLRGLLRGVFEGPSADWSIRRRLEEMESRGGPGTLHEQLRRVDPASAERLHSNDQRRIIRALEVFEISGEPLSVLQQNGPRAQTERPNRVVWLSPPRDWLYRRINARASQMITNGLIDEVARLLRRPQPLGNTARQGLGYKEVIDWFEANPSVMACDTDDRFQFLPNANAESVEGLVTTIQTRTRQFAKRQHTWFRNLEECRPVVIDGTERPEKIAENVVRMIHE